MYQPRAACCGKHFFEGLKALAIAAGSGLEDAYRLNPERGAIVVDVYILDAASKSACEN
jgi:hypothetical protein